MWDLLIDPTLWLAVAGWVILLVPTLAMCRAAARGDRIAERGRQDVAEQARSRDFTAWNADEDLAENVVRLPEREPAQVIDFPRQIGGWRR